MRKFLFGVLVSVAAVVGPGSAAWAGPPAIATGTFDCGPSITTIESTHTAGGNTIRTFTAAGCVYAGEVTGTFTLYATRVIHSDGTFVDHGTLVCTGCTIGGRTGDFTAAYAYDEVDGIVTTMSATGGLTGLHAQAHFERNPPSRSGTISWRYSFEP
jgi:hypothetical protein